MAAPVIEARGVTKVYDGQAVVDEVSLSVEAGKVTAVLGPSGSGKSTLLRCLSLLEHADGGEILLEGRRVGVRRRGDRWVRASERALAAVRSELGMVFQQFNLFPHMRAVENVMTGLVEVRRMSRREARRAAEGMLDRVGLAERSHAYPSELSGGQQQRVAIARAVVMQPKVMLFDEPTSALDPELVGEVLEAIEDLAASGMTMVIVTHELRFARRVADTVAVLDEGRLIEAAAPETLFSNPASDRTRRFLEAVYQ